MSLIVAMPSIAAESSEDGEAEAASIPVHRAVEPLKIDGKLDEPVWQDAHITPVKWKLQRGGGHEVETVANVRLAWDENYFYIGYETFDDNLQAKTEGLPQGPVERPRLPVRIDPGQADLIEFFIIMTSRRFFWELHHNASNNFSDVWCTVPDKDWGISKSSMQVWGIIFGHGMTLNDDQWSETTVETAVTLKPGKDGKPSTVNDDSDSDTGYFGEMRFPWVSLGTPTDRRTYKTMPPREEGGRTWRKPDIWDMAGQEIKLLTVVERAEADHRYFHSSPSFSGGWFHTGIDHYPQYLLVDQMVEGNGDDEEQP